MRSPGDDFFFFGTATIDLVGAFLSEAERILFGKLSGRARNHSFVRVAGSFLPAALCSAAFTPYLGKHLRQCEPLQMRSSRCFGA